MFDSDEKDPLKLPEALGQSDVFLEFQERLSLVAPVERPVILLGERGTGKELAAIRLHYLSRRWKGPFMALNCAALNSSLLESELFGYEKGAFTGADRRRTGRFEAAHGGTLFLDEIGSIPLEVQEKILRVVEYGSFERVGSPQKVEIDVRIIAATNADLKGIAASGGFKEDLLDRLSFEVLILPPLRERGDDILLLAHHFAARMAFELEREEIPGFDDDAIRALETYQWPGNIRELKNVVERAVYRSGTCLVKEVDFDPFKTGETVSRQLPVGRDEEKNDTVFEKGLFSMPFKSAVKELELVFLKRALKETRYNQKMAAAKLGLTYDQLRGLYRKYKDELD